MSFRKFLSSRLLVTHLPLAAVTLATVACRPTETNPADDDDDDGDDDDDDGSTSDDDGSDDATGACGDNTKDVLPELLAWEDKTPDPTVAVTGDPHEFDNKYQEILAHAVRFYGAQRSGKGPNWVQEGNEKGEQCFMLDGKDQDTDLTGGWHDAGDYLKYTNNNAFAVLAMLRAFQLFPDAFKDRDDPEYSGKANDVPDVLDEARYALDYLAKLLLDDKRFVFRIGDKRDHSHWFTAPYQSTLSVEKGGSERPTQVDGQADVAGISAAALAAGAAAFKPYDEDAAARYLSAAKAQLAYAEAHPKLTDDPDDFYDDDSYKDSLLCAYTELHRATNDEALLTKAKTLSDELKGTGWFLDWSNATPLCRFELARQGHKTSVEHLTSDVLDVRKWATTASENSCLRGLVVYKDETSKEFLTWGTIRYALGLAYTSALVWQVDADPKTRQEHANITKSQVDWALGKNQYKRNFIVGIDETSPKFPHHKNAYGRELDEFPKKGAIEGRFQLKGALVGGPNETGYEDDIANYQTNEVTIDYNAMLIGALAARAHMALIEAKK